MRWLVVWLLIAVSPALAAPAPTRLLDGALTIQLPAGMKVVPNERDLRGLALPAWASTRAELVLGNGAIIMVARNTFLRPDGDLRRSVMAELAIQDLAGIVRTLALPDTRAVTVDPPSPRRGDEHDLIHAAYVVGEDHKILVVGFYASGGAFDDVERWAEVARQATATLVVHDRWAESLSAVSSIVIGHFTVEVTAPLGWSLVPIGTQAVMAYEGTTLGSLAAVCGIDDAPVEAPSGATRAAIRFLATTATLHAWTLERAGHAEVIVSGIRAWCRVRGGRADAALRALRTLVAAIK